MKVKKKRDEFNVFISAEIEAESLDESVILEISLLHYTEYLAKQISYLSLYGWTQADMNLTRSLREEKRQVEAMIKVMKEAD